MYEAFDGVLAMYHDQGLAPFRTIDMGEGVCYTAGLPIIRTSPAADYDISLAGKGLTDETSFRHAIYLAIDVARRRHVSDTSSANPLPKLYHEKRDDSEKVRFAIPKAKTEKN